MKPRLLPYLLLLVALSGVSCFSERSAVTPPIDESLCASPRPDVVVIRNLSFQPAQLRVSRGTRVTWVNCDDIAHTSSANAGVWDSPLLSRHMTFSHTFETTGQYSYYCDPHPSMVATVIVE